VSAYDSFTSDSHSGRATSVLIFSLIGGFCGWLDGTGKGLHIPLDSSQIALNRRKRFPSFGGVQGRLTAGCSF